MSGAAGSSQWMYASGFDIDQSLRFDNTRVTYLHRNTVATAAGRKKFTISCWFKLGNSGGIAGSGSCAFFRSEDAQITYESNGKISVYGGSATSRTSAQFRDPAAWMHLVVAVDTTQGTAADRVKIYVNGVHKASENTSFPSQNTNVLGASGLQYIGSNFTPGGAIMDGYLAEYHFLDTIAKLPSDFGQTGAYGEWKPKEYSGSHGTNGFYLPFKADYTVEGFSTVVWKGSGGTLPNYIGGVGFNPDIVWIKNRDSAIGHFLYDSVRGVGVNLQPEGTGADATTAQQTAFNTDGFTVANIASGTATNKDGEKTVAWCWDMSNPTSNIGNTAIQFDNSDDSIDFELGTALGTGSFTVEYWTYIDSLQNYDTFFSTTRGGTGFNSGTDADGKAVWYRVGDDRLLESDDDTYVVGRWYHTAYVKNGTTIKVYVNGIEKDSATDNNDYSEATASIGSLDSGGEFAGIKLDAFRISNVARYTSNNFESPKARFTSDSNTLCLINSPTDVGGTIVDSGPASLSLSLTGTSVDASSLGKPAYPNTDGSITSLVRANPTYGQSIVSYSGSGSAATLGHGLSAAPEWILVKNRQNSDAWSVYYGDNTDYMVLNTTAATVDNANRWNDTSPTSSVFTVNTDHSVNADGEPYIAYCWHSVANYTKIGTYTGDASTDGSLSVAVGFKPAFVIIKRKNGANGWVMIDNTRNSSNPVNHYHYANTNDVEADGSLVNFTSTGFDLISNLAGINADGGEYTYMAHIDKREYAYWLDDSGNNNDWTSNGLTESDISVDSPSNNFAVLNPVDTNTINGTMGFQNGNLKALGNNGGTGRGVSTIGVNSGKWYAEVTIDTTHKQRIGIVDAVGLNLNPVGNDGVDYEAQAGQGIIYTYLNGTNNDTGTGSASGGVDVTNAAVGDILGIALDADNEDVRFFLNNTALGSEVTDLQRQGAGSTYFFNIRDGSGSGDDELSCTINFGQDSSFAGGRVAQGNTDGNGIGDFFYEPPSGFLALCTDNLPEPAVVPSNNFAATLYEGNGSTQDIAVGFQPDLTWIKNRDANDSHALVDSIRGVTEELTPDLNSAEVANDDGLTAFITTGFSLGDDVKYNTNNESYVSWNWKAGATELGTGDFTQGSIASTCRRNLEAGFSIVEYTGTETNGTVGHGLSKAPDFTFAHHRNSTGGWATFNSGLGATVNLDISTTGGTNDEAEIWQDTVPSATLVTVGNTTYNNKDDEIYVMYCFHDVDGFSKFGVYTGNGAADNAFVYTGFRPAFVYIKSTANSTPWMMWDTERDPDNPVINYLLSEANNVEDDAVASNTIDILSNGFKIRTAAADMGQAVVHAYVAFAETPLKYSNGR